MGRANTSGGSANPPSEPDDRSGGATSSSPLSRSNRTCASTPASASVTTRRRSPFPPARLTHGAMAVARRASAGTTGCGGSGWKIWVYGRRPAPDNGTFVYQC